MKRFIRPLLALSLIVSLIPVIAVAAPGLVEDLWPWGQAERDELALEPATTISTVDTVSSTEASEPLLEAGVAKGSPDAQTPSEGPKPVSPPPEDEAEEPTSTTAGEEATTTSSNGTTTATEKRTTSTKGKTPSSSTTTTQAQSRAPDNNGTTGAVAPPSPSNANQTLTGDIQGAFTGTVLFEGRVNLIGHVTIANGGRLIARPGVHVEGNGYALDFANGASADIQGTPTSTWSGNGSNANLKRDITFNNMKRIMFHQNAGKSTLRYFSVTNSGTSQPGDYPLHWHLNGNSTRGTLVEGVAVVNGKHHAFVPHGSHGITFKDTIAKNTSGEAYWWDPPGTNGSCARAKFCTLDNSNDITFRHTLADGVTNGPGDNRGFTLSAFQLGAGSGNVVVDSVARNVNPSHVKDCSGFHWPSQANQNAGGNIWVFENNSSSNPSGCHGIFVWQNGGGHHIIEDFKGSGIDHGAYGNEYEYRNIDVPYMEIHAAGTKVNGGAIDVVTTYRHRNDKQPTAEINGTKIGRFEIRNGSPNGDLPGTYVLNNTGLSCGDIVWADAVPGTKVIIDGREC